MNDAEHVDLRSLRLWVDRAYHDYAQLSARHSSRAERRRLRVLHEAVHGRVGKGPDSLRALMAAGVVRYRERLSLPDRSLPEALIVELVVEALWPVVVAARLPMDWLEDLSLITSPRLALLVNDARTLQDAGRKVDRTAMTRAIAGYNYSLGVLNLLDDLNDPRRGGSFLSAAAVATGVERPPIDPNLSPRRMLQWILAGAVSAGAAGLSASLAIKRTGQRSRHGSGYLNERLGPGREILSRKFHPR